MLVNLNDVLKKAQQEHYGVGLFNTIDTDMLQAAIEAAEEMKSPIIIGTAEILLPYGELELIAPSIISMAKNASVPVVVHYDHGLTFERCIQALKLGFSSIMFDGSTHDYATNIAHTKEIVKIAHSFNVTVEGEIGHVGLAQTDDGASVDRYTTVKEAVDYVNDTGVDALAIAIGTAHGAYKQAPKLDFNRLKEIRQALDTPLVLHGGSGLSNDDFKNTIKEGISKVNIFTDLLLAGEKAIKDGLTQSLGYMEMRNLKKDAIKEAVVKKMELFGSVNRC
ncbi:MAG: class II fructose-bisphosphate aldolase [Clostridiales bacterium]|nr:class II fructose-bisphosphate aldolase [Clostridiales bacterium]